ncbi:hypothetical protein [Rubinisphaera margarita]|nr:hypothetical protein [Rubinisphaera margarita]MCG6157111.1 hypothetical protein [Rubinisphaera margarita]
MKRGSAHYIPTPEEIEAECRRIQATWSEKERQYRQYGYSISGAQFKK